MTETNITHQKRKKKKKKGNPTDNDNNSPSVRFTFAVNDNARHKQGKILVQLDMEVEML